MRVASLFYLGLAAILLVGCQEYKTDASDAWKTYDGNRFTIAYPSNWKSVSTPEGVMFTAPNQGANLQAGYYPVPDIRTLDEYVSENKKSITAEFINELNKESQVEKVEILSEAEKTINGQRAIQLEIRITSKDSSPIRQEQVYLFKNQTGYILTVTSTEAGFEAEKPRFSQFFESFVIK